MEDENDPRSNAYDDYLAQIAKLGTATQQWSAERRSITEAVAAAVNKAYEERLPRSPKRSSLRSTDTTG